MKKLFVLLSILTILSAGVWAQIDDLTNDNQPQKEDSDNKNAPPPSFFLGNGCTDVCVSAMVDVFVSLFVNVLVAHHTYIMNQVDDPTKLSFDIEPSFAYGIDYDPDTSKFYDYFNVRPRIHGRWGVMSTDFRFNSLIDFQNWSADAFNALEWNIFQINIQPIEMHHVYIGTGFLYQLTNRALFNEHMIGYVYSTHRKEYMAVLEGRWATNYTDLIEFGEVDLHAEAKFFQVNHLLGYFMLGGVYQIHNGASRYHHVVMAMAGIRLNIH